MLTLNKIFVAIISYIVCATYLVLQSSRESLLGHVLNGQIKMFNTRHTAQLTALLNYRSTQYEIGLFNMKYDCLSINICNPDHNILVQVRFAKVKWSLISSLKNSLYKLPHPIPNDLRFKYLGN